MPFVCGILLACIHTFGNDWCTLNVPNINSFTFTCCKFVTFFKYLFALDILSIITVLIIISTGFSYLNERFVKLPGTIGVRAMSVVASIVVLIIGKIGYKKSNLLTTLAHNINFSEVLLDAMLSFLLFASALHFDYQKRSGRMEIHPRFIQYPMKNRV